MTKKHQIILPSLTESTEDDIKLFPLITKLEKYNINLLEKHGYEVYSDVTVTKYKLIPPPKKKSILNFFFPTILYISLCIQDFIKTGMWFNHLRYPYYCMFLRDIYKRKLTKKQQETLDKFSENQPISVVDQDGDSTIVEKEKQNNENKKIILFSSNNIGVGKTTTSVQLHDSLISENLEVQKTSFMDETREQLASIFYGLNLNPDNWTNPFYNKNKNIPTIFEPYEQKVVMRNLLCEYSDLLQNHFGKDVWAKCIGNFIECVNSDYIIIDDLRRPIELNYLIDKFGKENVITIYLTKEDVLDFKNQTSSLNESSNSYEGQLNPEEFDIQFTFTPNWSNSKDLINIIKLKLNIN